MVSPRPAIKPYTGGVSRESMDGDEENQASAAAAVEAVKLHKQKSLLNGKITKPQSNPKGWSKGKTKQADLDSHPHRIVTLGGEQVYEFCTNFVKTSKYEPYTFLPIFFWEEFDPRSKIANVYFLFIAVLQVIPSITNTYGYPLMLCPLLFVVLVDAIFMIIEDIERHRADKRANSSITHVWKQSANRFEPENWSEVQVGDILKIQNREPIPADVMLIGVREPNPEAPSGMCYVETKSLDGETNLKIRQVVKKLVGAILEEEDVSMLTGSVVMEHPNKLINNFAGTVAVKSRPNRARLSGEKDAVSEKNNSMLPAASSEKLPNAEEPVDPENILLRGCTLRNTSYAIALVLNTGMDTKIMMSMSKAPSKNSNISERINSEIKNVAILMFVFCAVGAALSASWETRHDTNTWYLTGKEHGDTRNGLVDFIVAFFYYILLLNSFIPISLYVSMNFVRFFQAWFMNQDLEMYHEETDTPMRVRTMNLNEDLGQVSHVFSDKTGTLTCNIMDFRKCSVGGIAYGKGITEIGRAALQVAGKEVPEEVLKAEELSRLYSVPHVNFYDPAIYRDMLADEKAGRSAVEQANRIDAFFTALAICHTVIPEKDEKGDVVLSASSPDDEALVLGAKYFGYDFLDRVDTIAIIGRSKVQEPTEPAPRGSMHQKSPPRAENNGDVTRQNYEILHILPFNSDRKRMSVLVMTPEGSIKLFCKGADTVMLPRLKGGDGDMAVQTVAHMDAFAKEGLRTLVVASAELSQEKYDEWATMYEEISTDMVEIAKRQRGEPNKIEEAMSVIEQDLDLLGASAIEDKLQDGVPGAISAIMSAGIKVWVLTGDKEETAINIGVACKLIWAEDRMDRLVINLHSKEEDEEGQDAGAKGELKKRASLRSSEDIEKLLETSLRKVMEAHDAYDETGIKPNPLCLVIDGPALLVAMGTLECQKALLRYAQACHSVVACRVTPDQKRSMVQLVKHNVPGSRTLSIGDGANDVPMIQGAHIGVGISGQEGMQAVNASDYSIAQFKFLIHLVLVHGRWNYRRSCRVVCFLFYKSVLFAVPLFYYAFFNGFSGTLFYDFVTSNEYAIIFTALPILLYGIYDQDVSRELCLRFTPMYHKGIDDTWLSPKVFWSWMLQALAEGVWYTLIPLYFITGGRRDNGNITSLLTPGTATYCLIVLAANLKIMWVQVRWNWIHIFILVASSGLWWLSTYVVSASFLTLNYDFFGVASKLFENGNYWLVILWCSVGVIVRDMAWKFDHRWWHPELHHVLVEHENSGVIPPDLEDMKTKPKKGSKKPAVPVPAPVTPRPADARLLPLPVVDGTPTTALTTAASVPARMLPPSMAERLSYSRQNSRQNSFLFPEPPLTDPRRSSRDLMGTVPVFIPFPEDCMQGDTASANATPARPVSARFGRLIQNSHSLNTTPVNRRPSIPGADGQPGRLSRSHSISAGGFAYSCDEYSQAKESEIICGAHSRRNSAEAHQLRLQQGADNMWNHPPSVPRLTPLTEGSREEYGSHHSLAHLSSRGHSSLMQEIPIEDAPETPSSAPPPGVDPLVFPASPKKSE